MNENEFLTLEECSQILGVPKRTIGFLIRTNQLECYRINSRVFRVKKDALAAFIETCKSKTNRVIRASQNAN